jgi:hypothetical protein
VILFIHPPVFQPCAPPPGIAQLTGVLRQQGVKCVTLDANIEGITHLLGVQRSASDRWTARAVRNLHRNLDILRCRAGYGNLDRYGRAVRELDHLLRVTPLSEGARLGLANYQDPNFSPVSSEDLLRAAESPELNPFFSYFRDRLTQLIHTHQPSHVGISLNFLSQALCSFAMAGFIKQFFPELKLVIGGGLATTWARSPGWKNPFAGLIDHVIAGPGEAELLSLLGIPTRAVKEACTPDYDDLPLDDYLSPGRVIPYSASSGCYWNNCAFCPERAEGNPYKPVPTEHVLSDLVELTDKYRPILIHLLDNALSPALMNSLIDHPPGIDWFGFSRITRHLTDPDFCRALKRSGCVMLKLGLESGDQSVLDREEKGVDLRLASAALKALSEAGIGTYVYLLFGTPAEGPDEARKTLDFTLSHARYIDYMNLAIFNMPIHGPEAPMFETRAHYEGDLSLYTGFRHPKGWDRGVVRQFLDKEFKRNPVVASILRNDPPVFTSNHAPFFLGGKQTTRVH